MLSAGTLRRARHRAGLTQAELARRVGTHQSAIARWERGSARPSLETLRELVRACGLELSVGLANADDSYDSHISSALAMSPADRVREALRAERLYERIRTAPRGRV
jgi:transcriptional regulator with XRE-family HTH domain